MLQDHSYPFSQLTDFFLNIVLIASLLGCGNSFAQEATSCDSKEPTSQNLSAAEIQHAKAQCLLENQQYNQALPILQALIAEEDDPIYAADLGRVYLGLQQFEQARTQFLKALNSNPPEDARKLLLIFIQLAEQHETESSEWIAKASLTYLFDTNVNSGPTKKTVMLFGLPFILGNDSMPKSDSALRLGFSGIHFRPISTNLAWQSNLNLEAQRYQSFSQYGTNQFSVDTGPHISVKDGRGDIYLPVGYLQFELNNKKYIENLSLSPQLRFIQNEKDVAYVNFIFNKKRYVENSLMSNYGEGINLTWQHQLLENLSVSPSIRYLKEIANDDTYTNKQVGVGLVFTANLPWEIRLTGESSLTNAKYKAAESWADAPRDEDRVNHSINLSRHISKSYYANVGWQYIRNYSNIDYFDMERQQITLQLISNF